MLILKIFLFIIGVPAILVGIGFWIYGIKEWRKPTDRSIPNPTLRELVALLVMLFGIPAVGSLLVWIAWNL